MLKILIVDDNCDKIKEIAKILCESIVDIKTAINLNDARKILIEEKFDLLILDMNIPIRIGADSKEDAGIDLLRDIENLDRINKPTNIIGITAHLELKEQYKKDFNESGWLLIHYSIINNEWKNQINNKVKYIIEEKKSCIINEEIKYNYDLAIITALRNTELDAVLNIKEANWTILTVKNDPTVYYEGIFRNENKSLKVIAASAVNMGMPSSAVLATKVIYNFTPKNLVMVGIAAGIKGESNFGDILIADQCWDYGNGKIMYNKSLEKREFKPNPQSISIDIDIKEKFKNNLTKYNNRIYEEWNGNKPDTILKTHIGPIASGAAVIQDENLIYEQVVSVNRKLIGIEMEIYGLYCAATQCRKPRPQFFALKSVCDFADSEKADNYQKYAAFTSAKYLYYFALDQL